MSKLLDKAIAEFRSLPEAEQDWAAANIRSIMRLPERSTEYRLTDERVEGVRRTLADLEAGWERLLTDEGTEEMWRRLGV